MVKKLKAYDNQSNENLAKLDCDQSLPFARVQREYTNAKQKKKDRAARGAGAKRRKLNGIKPVTTLRARKMFWYKLECVLTNSCATDQGEVIKFPTHS